MDCGRRGRSCDSQTGAGVLIQNVPINAVKKYVEREQ